MFKQLGKKAAAFMMGGLLALQGRAKWSPKGFLPLTPASTPDEVDAHFGVRRADDVELATFITMRRAKSLARYLRNQPGKLVRGAYVFDQRTGERAVLDD